MDSGEKMDRRFAMDVRDRVAQLWEGRLPEGLVVEIEDRRVTLSGCVQDEVIAQAIERAVAGTPGLLGIHNVLRTREPARARSEAMQMDSGGMHGALVEPPYGQINHKV